MAKARGRGAARSRELGWWPALGLAALVFAVYAPALRGGFVWDDDSYVTDNPLLRSAAGLWRIWTAPGATPQYYPLTFTAFWSGFHLWGLDPYGYHLCNVLLHAATAVLLWRLLRRLDLPAAWWAAAIFAVHPINVESVAWITELKNVLSGFFAVAAAIAYWRYVESERDEDPVGRHSRPYLAPSGIGRHSRPYLAALGLFVLSMLSKTAACTLPAVLAVLLWWRRGRIGSRELVPLLPFFAVGIGLASVTVWVETGKVGAAGADWALSSLQRILLAGRALWFYAVKLLWPHPLAFVYPRWRIDPLSWWQYLYPAGAAVVVAGLWVARDRIGRAPLAVALLFAGMLFPILGFFNVYLMRYTFVADHFAYLPSMALSAALAGGAATWVGGDPRRRRAAAIAAALVVAALGSRAWAQARIYRDAETLWLATLAVNPDAWMAHTNLGNLLLARGRAVEAAQHHRAAVALQPQRSEPHNNLGNALATAGDLVAGIESFRRALEIQPGYVEAHINLGHALAARGDTAAAAEEYRTALGLEPDAAEAHAGLGHLLAARGDGVAAIQEYEAALALRPERVDVQNNLGLLLAQQGRLDDAEIHYRAALAIDPRNAEAHNNLANALAARGAHSEAIEHYTAALQLRPDDSRLRHNLERSLAASQRPAEGANSAADEHR